MTKEQIMKIARESGCPEPMVFSVAYERFATLVRNAALEEAAIELKGDFTLNGEGISEVLRAMKEPTT